MKYAVTLFVTFVLCSSRLWSALSFVITPEWLVHESSLSFVGIPQSLETSHLGRDRWLTSVKFRIDKCIKGPLSIGDVVTVSSIDSKGALDKMNLNEVVGRKRNVLVMATIASWDAPNEVAGRYIFRPHLLNRPVIYDDEPVRGIYTEAGTAIREYSEVIKRIEAQSAKEAGLYQRCWSGTIARRDLHAEWGTDAAKDLGGRGTMLIVSLAYLEKEILHPRMESEQDAASDADKASE